MIHPISFISKTEKKEEDGIEVSFSKFLSKDDSIFIKDEPVVENKKKLGRPAKKETRTMSDGNEMIPADGSLPMYQTNEPYIESYQETNNMIKTAIGQIDMISGDLKSELDIIRNSKTLKGKYTYIPNIASTLGTLMSTKVTAIRELNKVMTDAHTLELRRIKDLKLDQKDSNDDKSVMDMYNAFISMPVNGSTPQFAPPMSDLSLMGGVNNMIRSAIGEADYGGYINNLTPTQNTMRHEHNRDIKTVVIYDQSSGRRWFDVMNTRTGESIPNTSRPDNMFLEDCVLDLNNRIARNTNLDQTFPIVMVGDNSLKY